jgi:hypothetical protein
MCTAGFSWKRVWVVVIGTKAPAHVPSHANLIQGDHKSRKPSDRAPG